MIMKKQSQAKIWEIFGGGLDSLYVIADSFDEALSKARILNCRYDSGRIHDKPMCDFSGNPRFCKTVFPSVFIPIGRKHNAIDARTGKKEYSINYAIISSEEQRGALFGKIIALFTEHGFDERKFELFSFSDKMTFYTNTKIIAYCAGKLHLGNVKSCDEYFERIEVDSKFYGYHFTAESDFEALKLFAKMIHDESAKGEVI